MGGSSSKASQYKLKVLESRVTPERSPQSSSNVLDSAVSGSPTLKSPGGRRGSVGSQNAKARPQSATVDQKRRNTVTVLPSTRSEVFSLQSLQSNSKLTAPSKVESSPMLKDREDSVFGIECSSKYPWLMRKANLANMPMKSITVGRIIGKGYMGTVRLCKTPKGHHFVMKALSKDFITKHACERHVANEQLVLSSLRSPFCVKYFGVLEDKSRQYLCMEYVPGGQLFRRLGRKTFFPPDEAKFYIMEIFCAVEHVHRLGFVYRDLKPENIAIDEEGHIKLLDFGFSIAYDPSHRLHTNCGTPAYLSPEQLDGKLTNGYTNVIDWWAYGVLLFELLTGRTPFAKSAQDSPYEIFLRILQNKIHFPMGFDGEARSLVAALCNSQVENRLCEMEEIKRHRYYTVPWAAVTERRLLPPFVPDLPEVGDSHYFRTFDE